MWIQLPVHSHLGICAPCCQCQQHGADTPGPHGAAVDWAGFISLGVRCPRCCPADVLPPQQRGQELLYQAVWLPLAALISLGCLLCCCVCGPGGSSWARRTICVSSLPSPRAHSIGIFHIPSALSHLCRYLALILLGFTFCFWALLLLLPRSQLFQFLYVQLLSYAPRSVNVVSSFPREQNASCFLNLIPDFFKVSERLHGFA